MRRRPSLGIPALAAIAAAAVVTVSHSGPRPRASIGATTWRGVVGASHPQVALAQRRIVVLLTPSVAQRLAAAGGYATEQQERQWTAQAYAAQQQVLVVLTAHGLGVRPDFTFARVLDGFSATLDPRAVALLEHDPRVPGIYPVRAAFPASIATGAFATRTAAIAPPGLDGTGAGAARLDTG